ncbi:unnamed protein product [Pedinophyceae sp. YPF-701]|nr:unnamed protein product [Pedinophyceae sp. YPF-701]
MRALFLLLLLFAAICPALPERIYVADIRGYFPDADGNPIHRPDGQSCVSTCQQNLLPGGATPPNVITACQRSCAYNRTVLSQLDRGTSFQQEIAPDTLYGQGLFDSTPYSLMTINFLREILYTYVPGRGRMPDWQCFRLNRGSGCGYRPGDPNPWGLRRIDLRTGQHLPPPRPTETVAGSGIFAGGMQYAPIQMEYDLFSSSLLILAHGYPVADPALGDRGQRVLSFLAVNETTGAAIDQTGPRLSGIGPWTVTFCKACRYRPQDFGGPQLLYDYTDTVGSAYTWDQLDQTFYTVLWDPVVGDASRTLFAIRRKTDFTLSDPTQNVFSIKVEWPAFKYYKWPDELQIATSLEFSPRMTEQLPTVAGGEASFGPIASAQNQKYLTAVVNLKEPSGPCAPAINPGGRGLKCGHRLTADEVAQHNIWVDTAKSYMGFLEPTNPHVCLCPAAAVRINIDVADELLVAGEQTDNQGNTGTQLQVLGNVFLDPSAAPYTVLEYLDAKYPAEVTPQGGRKASQDAFTPNQPTPYLAPFVSTFFAMAPIDPSAGGNQVTGEQQARSYQVDVPLDSYGKPYQTASPVVSGANGYRLTDFTIGTDVIRTNRVTQRRQLPHLPVFLFSDDKYSLAIRDQLATFFFVTTSGPKSYLDSPYGLERSELTCPFKPITCAQCRTNIQNELEAVAFPDGLQAFQSDTALRLFWQGSSQFLTKYPSLFTQDPQQFDRSGAPLPTSFSFNCPETCDRYSCDQCVALFGLECKAYVFAGEESSLKITAITLFGSQSRTKTDVFVGSFSASNFTNVDNPAALPAQPFTAGPVFRTSQDVNGNPVVGGTIPAPTDTAALLSAGWGYPNIWDASTFPRPTGAVLPDGVSTAPECAPTSLYPTGRCNRFIVRPRSIGSTGGVYRLALGVDLIGNYTLDVTFRGSPEEYNEDGTPNVGVPIRGSPFRLTVLPGRVDSRQSRLHGTGVTAATVGVTTSFTATLRDRYGNELLPPSFALNIFPYVLRTRLVGGGATIVADAECTLSAAQGTGLVCRAVPGSNPTSTSDPAGLTSWAEFLPPADPRVDRRWTVRYFPTRRNRLDPTLVVNLEVQGAALPTPYTVPLAQGVTSAVTSFPLESGNDVGLGLSAAALIAGRSFSFTIQAVDRFGNRQSDDVGDKFGAVITDSFQNCAAVLSNSTAAETAALHPTCTQQPAATLVPSVNVTFAGDGRYVVTYTVFRAGPTRLNVVLGALQLKLPDGAPAGVSYPLELTIVAGPTSPAHCTLETPGVRRAGVLQQIEYVLQARDRFGNAKDQLEPAYLSLTQQFPPLLEVLYQETCVGALGSAPCEGVPARVLSGVLLNEVPAQRSSGSLGTYDDITGEVAFVYSVGSPGNGRFTLTFETNLAGRFQMQFSLRAALDSGLLGASGFITGADGAPGTGTFAATAPVRSPHILVLAPLTVPPVFVELLSLRNRTDLPLTLFSTNEGVTHAIRPTPTLAVESSTTIRGSVGEAATVYLQRRDKFGNAVPQPFASIEVSIIGTSSGNIVRLGFPPSSPNAPVVTHLGRGLYEIKYSTTVSADFSVGIFADGLETFVPDATAFPVELVPSGGRFQLTVEPGPASVANTGAYGPGLIGARVDKGETTIFIEPRDQFGNRINLVDGDADSLALAARFQLYLRRCTSVVFSDANCPGLWVTGSQDPSFVIIKDVVVENGLLVARYQPTGGDAFVAVEVRLDGVPVTGDTDVPAISPAGAFLKMVPQGGFEPSRVMIRFASGVGTPNPAQSKLFLLNKILMPRPVIRTEVGTRQSLLLQPFDQDGIPVNEPGTLRVLDVELYYLASLQDGRPATATLPQTPDYSATLIADSSLFLVNANGTYGFDSGPVLDYDTSTGQASTGIVRSGWYALIVRIQATTSLLPAAPIASMPFTGLRFAPGPTDVARCEVLHQIASSGAQLRVLENTPTSNPDLYTVLDSIPHFTVSAGEVVEVVVRARDSFNNLAFWDELQGGDPFEAAMTPLGASFGALQGNLTDFRTGTYLFRFNTALSARFRLVLSLRGQVLSGSDGSPGGSATFADAQGLKYVPVFVRPGPLHVPSTRAVTTLGQRALNTTQPEVGTVFSITVIERDVFGNDRTEATLDAQGLPVRFVVEVNVPGKPLYGLNPSGQVTADGATVSQPVYSVTATSPQHILRFLVGGTSPPFLSGPATLRVTLGGVDIRGSPFAMVFTAGPFTFTQCDAYGPGVNIDNLLPGVTTAAGISTSVFLQPRDKYGNKILVSGQSLSLQLDPISGGLVAAAESTFDDALKLYKMTYTALSNDTFSLNIKHGGIPLATERFLYQNKQGVIEPRPAGGYSQDKIRTQFPVPTGVATLTEGVVINVSPGPLSPTETYAVDRDATKPFPTIRGGARVAETYTDDNLRFSIKAIDIFGKRKTDVGQGTSFYTELRWVRDLNGNPSATNPFAGIDATEATFYTLRSDNATGTSYWFRVVPVQQEAGTEFHHSVPSLPLVAAGFYELHAFFDDGLGNITPLGFGDVASPYIFKVNTGLSDGQTSSAAPGRRSARRLARSLKQAAASTRIVAAGVRESITLSLRDRFGNAQSFDSFRRLDNVLVRVGEAPLSGASVCPWSPNPLNATRLPPVTTVPPSGCQLVHINANVSAVSNCSGLCLPDYSASGIDLRVTSIISSGTVDISFTIDGQFPAVVGAGYIMEISLNEQALSGSPISLVVIPGPTSGPSSEAFSALTAEVGVPKTIDFVARDKYGNVQTAAGDQSALFVVLLTLSARASDGATNVVFGCTQNTGSQSCLPITVQALSNGADGRYRASFEVRTSSQVIVSSLGDVASASSSTPSREDYRLALRFCPTASCSSANNFFNPAAGGFNSETQAFNPLPLFVAPGDIDARQCIAYGPDLLQGGLVNQPDKGIQTVAVFIIEARDTFGNRQLSGGATFEVVVYTPRRQFPFVAVDLGAQFPGLYNATFVPLDAGQYTILIRLVSPAPGQNAVATGFIANSKTFLAFYRQVDGDLSPPDSHLVSFTGKRLTALEPVKAGDTLDLLLQASAAPQKGLGAGAKKLGGDVAVLYMIATDTGINTTVFLTDFSAAPQPPYKMSGRYGLAIDGSRLLQVAGRYLLDIQMCPGAEGSQALPMSERSCAPGTSLQRIGGAPYELIVTGRAVDPTQSYIIELRNQALLQAGSTQAGTVVTMMVQGKDNFGNVVPYDPLTSPEVAAALDVTILGLANGVRFRRIAGNSEALGDGEYRVFAAFDGLIIIQFLSNLAQRLRISATLLSFTLQEPTVLTVNAGPVDVANSVIRGNLQGGSAGETQFFSVVSQDQFSNRVLLGGTDWRVRMAIRAPITAPGVGDTTLTAQSKVVKNLVDDGTGTLVDAFQSVGAFTYLGDVVLEVSSQVTIDDTNDGTYAVQYVSQVAGSYVLEVFTEQEDATGTILTSRICSTLTARAACQLLGTLDGQGFALNFTALPPSPTRSFVQSDAGLLTASTGGTEVLLPIAALDQYRNRQTQGGFVFTASMQHRTRDVKLLGAVIFTQAAGYVVRFRPQVAGTYDLSIKRQAQDILGRVDGALVQGPFAHVVAPGRLSSVASTVTHPWAVVVNARERKPHLVFATIAGQTTTFNISAFDAFSNRITSGGEPVVVQIGSVFDGAVTDNGDGTYTVRYRVVTAGTYDLTISSNQEVVRLPSRAFNAARSGFELEVLPGNATVLPSAVVGAGVLGGTAESPLDVIVRPTDGFANSIVRSLGLWRCADQVAYTRPDGLGDEKNFPTAFDQTACIRQGSFARRPVHLAADVHVTRRNSTSTLRVLSSDDRNGVVQLGYRLAVSGLYNMTLQDVDTGRQVFPPNSGTQTVTVQPSSPAPSTTLVSGGVLQPGTCPPAGAQQRLVVFPRDAVGNNLTAVPASLKRGNAIAVRGAVTQDAATTSVAPSVAYTDILYPASPAEEAEYRAFNPTGLPQSARLAVTFTPPRPGRYAITVAYGAQPVQGSPFAFVVAPALLGALATGAAASHPHACRPGARCTEASTPFSVFPVGITARWRIRTRDVFGNDITDAHGCAVGLGASSACAATGTQDGCPFKLLAQLPDGSQVSNVAGYRGGALSSSIRIVEGVSGLYDVLVPLTAAGTYTVSLAFTSASDSSFSAVATTGLTVNITSGTVTEALATPSGAPTTSGLDSFLLKPAAVLNAQAGADKFVELQTAAKACRSGSNLTPLTPACSGVEVLVPTATNPSGQDLTGLIAFASPLLSQALAPTNATLAAALATTFSAPTASVVPDAATNTGLYRLNFRTERSGNFRLQAIMGTEALVFGTSSIINTVIYPAGVSAANSMAVPVGRGTAGAQTSVQVILRDRFGNVAVDRPFDPSQDRASLSLTFRRPAHPSGPSRLTVPQMESLSSTLASRTNANGTITLTFAANVAGRYDAAVFLTGPSTADASGRSTLVEIPGSPIAIDVNAAAASAAETVLRGRGGASVSEVLAGALAGTELVLEIVTRDAFGNLVTNAAAIERLLLRIVGVGTSYDTSATLASLGNGVFSAAFTPPDIGVYELRLFVGGQLKSAGPGLPTAEGIITRIRTEPTRTTAVGPGLIGSLAGTRSTFIITSRNIFGNPTLRGGEAVNVTYTPTTDVNANRVPLTAGAATVIDNSLLPDVSGAFNPGSYIVFYTIVNFGTYTLDVKINGEHIKGSPYTIEISPALPPTQGRASLSPVGSTMTVPFTGLGGRPVETNRGGITGLVSCSRIFDDASVAILGIGPRCSFETPSQLKIYVGYSATFALNEELRFLANVIFTKELNSIATAGTTVVTLPPAAPSPVAIVRAPARLSVCDDLVLDASGSYGSAGRPLTFRYGMLPNRPNELAISRILDAATAVGTNPRVTIPGELLAADTTYSFFVSVHNFLKQSTITSFEVRRLSIPIPRVVAEGDPLIRARRDLDLFVRASVAFPDNNEPRCQVPDFDIDFTWMFDTSVDRGLFTFPMDTRTRNSRQLFIPANTLLPGATYYLKVVGNVQGQPQLRTEAKTAIQVDYAPLQINLVSPSSVAVSQTFRLDASQAVDPNDPTPDNPQLPFGPFLFAWSCNPMDGDTVLTGQECFVDDRGILVPDQTQKFVSIPGGTLSPGRYQFSVVVTKEPLTDANGNNLNRVVQIRKVVEVFPTADGVVECYPDLKIEALSRAIINSNEKLALIAEARPPTGCPTGINYRWDVLQGILNITDYPGTLATPRTAPKLVLRPFALFPGEVYVMRVVATSPATGLSSFDDVTFTVNGAPSSGTCQVLPTRGVVGLTNFRLDCVGWEDDSKQAVLYEHRYMDTNGTSVPLVSATADSTFATIIPPIVDAPQSITIETFVRDNLGAKTLTTVTIQELAPPPYATLTADVLCTNSSVVACPCTLVAPPGGGVASCTFPATGRIAFAAILSGLPLDQAAGAGNVGALVTTVKTAVFALLEANVADPVDAAAKALIVDRLIISVRAVSLRLKFTREELDMYADLLGTISRDPQLLLIPAIQSTVESLLALALSDAVATGIRQEAATGLLSSISSFDDVNLNQAITPAAAANLTAANATTNATAGAAAAANATAGNGTAGGGRLLFTRRTLLTAGALRRSGGRSLLGGRRGRRSLLQQSTATEGEQLEAEKAAASLFLTDQLTQASSNGLVDGEDAVSVASKNVGFQVQELSNPAGDFEPAATGGPTPKISVPGGTLDFGTRSVGITTTNNVKNPYDSLDKGATPVQSSVVSMSVRAGTGANRDVVDIAISDQQKPISIRVPTALSGSSCRRTEGACRFFDEATQTWSEKGLFKKDAGDGFVTCETIHLTAFGVAADDIVPELNLVNPIGDADLLTKLDLSNALALIVVGMLLAGFSAMMIYGYRKDLKDRHKLHLQLKMTLLQGGEEKPNPAKHARPTVPENAPDERVEVDVWKDVRTAVLVDNEVASIIYTRPTDHYTRPQRLLVLLSIILGQIAIVAVFFGIDPSNIAAKAVIGVVTSLAVAPARFMFKWVFQRSSYVKPVQRDLKLRRWHLARAQGRPVQWSLRFYTSDIAMAGTGANVSITVHGAKQQFGPINISNGKGLFERGQMDEFAVQFPDVGEIQKVEVSHDGRGLGAGWHLDRVELVRQDTGDEYEFKCGHWLDTNQDADGGFVSRVLPLLRKREGRVQRASRAGAEEEAQMRPRGSVQFAARDEPRKPGRGKARRSSIVPMSDDGTPGTGVRPLTASQGIPVPLSPPGGQFASPQGSPMRGRALGGPRTAALLANVPDVPIPPPPTSGVPRPRTLRNRVNALQGAMQATSMMVRGNVPAPSSGTPRPFRGRLARLQSAQRGLLPVQSSVNYARSPTGAASVRRLLQGVDGSGTVQNVPYHILHATVTIQRRWRHHMAMQHLKRSEAATKIQAAWRGEMTRRIIRDEARGIKIIEDQRERARAGPSARASADVPAPYAGASVRDWLGAAANQRAGAHSGGGSRSGGAEAGPVSRAARQQEYRRKLREARRAHRRKVMQERLRAKGFPRWVMWIGYTLCAVWIAACSYFIILYGVAFPPAVSRAWIFSSLFSVFLELFIQDPIKVAVLGFVKARLLKKLPGKK